ncbi:hypothetical protein MKZ38_008472 [Zalerion maritima]|uniref:Uncharacterized protein n=1 Tax=Zalerion maritima TaxID=339359 RepID=A0AAD5RVV2_9PEZI|nr:hypothetical protein MKZ38_008472 [Zalerion maritima]
MPPPEDPRKGPNIFRAGDSKNQMPVQDGDSAQVTSPSAPTRDSNSAPENDSRVDRIHKENKRPQLLLYRPHTPISTTAMVETDPDETKENMAELSAQLKSRASDDGNETKATTTPQGQSKRRKAQHPHSPEFRRKLSNSSDSASREDRYQVVAPDSPPKTEAPTSSPPSKSGQKAEPEAPRNDVEAQMLARVGNILRVLRADNRRTPLPSQRMSPQSQPPPRPATCPRDTDQDMEAHLDEIMGIGSEPTSIQLPKPHPLSFPQRLLQRMYNRSRGFPPGLRSRLPQPLNPIPLSVSSIPAQQVESSEARARKGTSLMPRALREPDLLSPGNSAGRRTPSLWHTIENRPRMANEVRPSSNDAIIGHNTIGKVGPRSRRQPQYWKQGVKMLQVQRYCWRSRIISSLNPLWEELAMLLARGRATGIRLEGRMDAVTALMDTDEKTLKAFFAEVSGGGELLGEDLDDYVNETEDDEDTNSDWWYSDDGGEEDDGDRAYEKQERDTDNDIAVHDSGDVERGDLSVADS